MNSPFSRNFTYPYAAPVTLTNNLRCVVANNPGPFTFTGTNTFIIGHGEVAILDPGPDDENHLTALVKCLEGETVSHILVSHTHKDHMGLCARLQERTGAPTYAFSRHDIKAEEEMTKEKVSSACDKSFTPDHMLKHKDCLTISGLTIEALHTPGHTEDHLCFSMKDDNLLLTGDHVMGWSTSIIAPPDGHMGDYLNSLELLLGRGEQTYHPTHGSPIEDPLACVKYLINHRHKRESAILDRLEKAPATIPDIVGTVYKGLDKALIGAAMLSTQAHLIWLEEKNQVQNNKPETKSLTEAVYQLI